MRYLSTLWILIAALAISSHAKAEKPHKDIPPGLQKKAERGDSLPPGWQKKLRPGATLTNDVYRQRDIVVPVDDQGLVTVKIGGKLIRLVDATREVVEVLD